MKTFTLKTSKQVLTVLTLSVAFTTILGCGSSKSAKKNDDFFTSGSREADQRATQRMAKEQQLEGTGPKETKKTGSGENDAKGGQSQAKLTLFERLGGEQGIAAIVEDFTTRALNDPRVDWQRKGTKHGGLFTRHDSSWNSTPENVATLKKHLVQFLSLASGGPAQYDGREIKSVHAGMHISNSEFDAALGDLKASLDKAQVSNKEQKELLAIVESTRPQIATER
jgi:hemoglobin